MEIPQGELLRRRVLDDPGTVLANALDRELTGYARLEPQETLLLDSGGTGVLVFEDGVPAAAYYTGTDSGGPTAVDEFATGGPYRLALYRLDGEVLEKITDSEALVVPPALPARRLAEDPGLAERIEHQAPDDRPAADTDADGTNPVAAFLDDEQQIEEIRERARDEAVSRATEWNLPVDDEQQPPAAQRDQT